MRVVLLSLVLVVACESRDVGSGATSADAGVPVAPASSPVARLDAFVADGARPTDADTAVVEAVRELRAAHAQTKLEPEARRALLALFRRLRASTLKARHHALMREVERALVDVADPQWEPALVAMLSARMPKPERATRKALLDQVYWQRTAIEVLGKMRSPTAVEPLIRVVLSPFKKPVAGAALLALTRIGAPAVPPLVRLLEGSAVVLVRYAQREARRAVEEGLLDEADVKRAHMAGALRMLGRLGTEAAKKPVMAATSSESAWLRRHAVAELHHLPKDVALVDRFKHVYAEVGLEDRMYGGERAAVALLRTAAHLFEPGMTKWLLGEMKKLGAHGEGVAEVRSAMLGNALRAADGELWPQVKRLHTGVLAGVEGAEHERRERAYGEAKALLDRCEDDAACHAAALEGVGPGAMPARRAAERLAIIGGASVRGELVRLAIATTNNHAREVLAAAVLAVSPEGDAGAARAIESAHSQAVAAGDEPKAAAVKPLLHTAAVLRGRGAT